MVEVAALESSADKFRHKNLLHALQYHRSIAVSANTRLRQPILLLLFASGTAMSITILDKVELL